VRCNRLDTSEHFLNIKLRTQTQLSEIRKPHAIYCYDVCSRRSLRTIMLLNHHIAALQYESRRTVSNDVQLRYTLIGKKKAEAVGSSRSYIQRVRLIRVQRQTFASVRDRISSQPNRKPNGSVAVYVRSIFLIQLAFSDLTKSSTITHDYSI